MSQQMPPGFAPFRPMPAPSMAQPPPPQMGGAPQGFPQGAPPQMAPPPQGFPNVQRLQQFAGGNQYGGQPPNPFQSQGQAPRFFGASASAPNLQVPGTVQNHYAPPTVKYADLPLSMTTSTPRAPTSFIGANPNAYQPPTASPVNPTAPGGGSVFNPGTAKAPTAMLPPVQMPAPAPGPSPAAAQPPVTAPPYVPAPAPVAQPSPFALPPAAPAGNTYRPPTAGAAPSFGAVRLSDRREKRILSLKEILGA